MKNKKKVGIWFGGCSTEYEVSLQSAEAVINNLNRQLYEPVLIGIDKKGCWYLYEGETKLIGQDRWRQEGACYPVVASPDRELHGLLVFRDERVERVSLDAALPILHGKNGEDGTVQGVLELAGIPIAGCNTLSSAVCMEKDMAHRLVAAAGVKVPRTYLFSRAQVSSDLEEYRRRSRAELKAAQTDAELKGKLAAWGNDLGYPLFVKPLRAGSSFGISRVNCEEELYDAVELAFEHDSLCLMEEGINGFEVGCAVLGDPYDGTGELLVGEVDEIELSEGFFDYAEKYTLKTSSIHVPARISAEKAQEIKETSRVIYRALGCSYFARIDMFLTPEGDIYFNEANTIPGFTSHSRYPSMMKAIGISFADVIDAILALVFK